MRFHIKLFYISILNIPIILILDGPKKELPPLTCQTKLQTKSFCLVSFIKTRHFSPFVAPVWMQHWIMNLYSEDTLYRRN